MIRGTTGLIAHIGYPTHTFKSPMIYNPYFEQAGIDAVVVPMGCKPEHYAALLKAVFALENIRGALITMPHKVSTVGLLDEATATVKIAGSCNAVRRSARPSRSSSLNDGFQQFFHVPQDLPKKHEIPGRSLRSAPVLAKLPLGVLPKPSLSEAGITGRAHIETWGTTAPEGAPHLIPSPTPSSPTRSTRRRTSR